MQVRILPKIGLLCGRVALASMLALALDTAQAVTPKLAAGDSHSLSLRPDGVVLAWGYNRFGQLGDGTAIARRSARRVAGLYGVTDVSAGHDHSLAVTNDGRVWAWGNNVYGQLGDGTPVGKRSPVRLPGFGRVVAVAAGAYHSLALKADGTVVAWGWNAFGALGDGTDVSTRSSPVPVIGLNGIVAVAAGSYYSIAVKADGTVYTWGAGGSGQLGDGSTTVSRNIPSLVPGLSSVARVAAGTSHILALKSNGTLVAWGSNFSGQLGDGSNSMRLVPVSVPSLSSIVAIAAGGAHSLALASNGTVSAWGQNTSYQLGDPSVFGSVPPIDAWNPLTVESLAGVTGLGAGGIHSLAQKPDGRVVAWGGNGNGQLADGTAFNRRHPVVSGGVVGFATVSAGGKHMIAVKADGSVWTWGSNQYGQLGDGTPAVRDSPAPVPGLADFITAAAGDTHSLAVKGDGTVWAWGSNTSGELGIGNTAPQPVPIRVPGLTDVVAVAAGTSVSMAIKGDGSVWAWGWNLYGQLGIGSYADQHSPVQITALSNVVDVKTQFGNSLALTSNGGVLSWGWNVYGALGDGTVDASRFQSAPVQVSGLASGATAIAMQGGMGFALKGSDGSIAAWGQNYFGSLGDGSTTDRPAPVVVTGLYDMQAIAVSHAIDANGTIWSWGFNGYGQVGDGSTTDRHSPVPLAGIAPPIAIAAGGGSTVALMSDGTIWSWGLNDMGQLGNGQTRGISENPLVNRYFPARINDGFMSSGLAHPGWDLYAWAFDSTNWTLDPNAIQGLSSYAGPESLSATFVPDGGQIAISYTGTIAEGYVRFTRRVSSQAGHDFLTFYVDGVLKGEWSGEVPWDWAGTLVTAGTHTLLWRYEKDATGSGGLDSAWVDSVDLPIAGPRQTNRSSLIPVLMLLLN